MGRNTSITTVSRPMCERIEVSAPAQIFGNPGVTFRFRDYFREGLGDCSAASLFTSNTSFGWPLHRINFGAV